MNSGAATWGCPQACGGEPSVEASKSLAKEVVPTLVGVNHGRLITATFDSEVVPTFVGVNRT